MHSIDTVYSYACLVVPWSVCLSVLVTTVNPAKTDEPTEMPFAVKLVWAKKSTYQMEDADWRQLAKTMNRPFRGGDAALCQITVTTCHTV